MCERARRHLEPTSTLEGKKVLPPGAPNFLPRATLRFPSLAGLANTEYFIMVYCGVSLRGAKSAFPRPGTIGALLGHSRYTISYYRY